jgi:hypothetical protein
MSSIKLAKTRRSDVQPHLASLLWLWLSPWRHDIQPNDTKPKGTQRNELSGSTPEKTIFILLW